MWIVMKMQKTARVQFSGTKFLIQDVPVSGMADGCIGCLLVFEDKEDAIKYAGGEENLIEVVFAEDSSDGNVKVFYKSNYEPEPEPNHDQFENGGPDDESQIPF